MLALYRAKAKCLNLSALADEVATELARIAKETPDDDRGRARFRPDTAVLCVI
jgi:hypothetical protein